MERNIIPYRNKRAKWQFSIFECKDLRFYGGDYEEFRLLGYGAV
jgi:hypothetical protein